MVFAPEANQEIVLDLSGGGTYILQVLDTWTMEVKEEKAIDAGEFRYATSDPYMALKIVR